VKALTAVLAGALVGVLLFGILVGLKLLGVV
jgi:hypothetical protein